MKFLSIRFQRWVVKEELPVKSTPSQSETHYQPSIVTNFFVAIYQ